MNNKKIEFKETIHNIKLTWKLTKGARHYLLGFLLTTIILCIISVITPIFSAKQVMYITNGEFISLTYIAIIILVFEITRNIVRFLYRKASQLFFRKTLTNIQIELSKEILKLETKEIDNNTSGLFIERLNKDSNSLANIFEDLISIMVEIISNVGVLGAIFIVNKIMFLYFVITITLLYILTRIRMQKRFSVDKDLRKLYEKNTSLIGEMVRGLKDVKVLNSDDNFLNKLKERLIDTNNKRYEMSEVDRRWVLFNGSIQDIIYFIFIILGIYLVNNNELTIENFIIIYMYRDRLYDLLNYLSSMIEFIKDFSLSASRVFEIFEGDKFKKEEFGNKSLKKVKGDFEFKNVSFSYKNEIPIIKNLSFKINANETVAFVGRSGAGKSTIFNLLTKLYHPNSGTILIDNIDINKLTKDSIRNNISIITQNPYIFNFSIKDNLKIVNPDLTEKEMIKACKNASLHDFIMSLPDKYDTVVGEGGVTLSGGEKQRLAIARAFIRNTEIILFDEATSALDNETQSHIQDAITNLKKTKTILIIAHRLSTVVNSDRILLIDDGQIVGEGSHINLLKTNKLYKELYNNELK